MAKPVVGALHHPHCDPRKEAVAFQLAPLYEFDEEAKAKITMILQAVMPGVVVETTDRPDVLRVVRHDYIGEDNWAAHDEVTLNKLLQESVLVDRATAGAGPWQVMVVLNFTPTPAHMNYLLANIPGACHLTPAGHPYPPQFVVAIVLSLGKTDKIFDVKSNIMGALRFA